MDIAKAKAYKKFAAFCNSVKSFVPHSSGESFEATECSYSN